MCNLLESIILDIVSKDETNPECLPIIVEEGEDIVVEITTSAWVDPDYKELNTSGRTFRISGFDAEERFIALRRVPDDYTMTYGEEQYIMDSIGAREEFEALVYN